MSDWDEIPWGLRLRIQSLNVLYYLLGAGTRVILLFLAILSMSAIKYYVLPGVAGLFLCLVLMWLDVRTASASTQEGASTRQTLLLRVIDFLLYPIGVLFHALILGITVVCVDLVWSQYFGAIIGVAIGLTLICVLSQEVPESKDWLKVDHFLMR